MARYRNNMYEIMEYQRIANLAKKIMFTNNCCISDCKAVLTLGTNLELITKNKQIIAEINNIMAYVALKASELENKDYYIEEAYRHTKIKHKYAPDDSSVMLLYNIANAKMDKELLKQALEALRKHSTNGTAYHEIVGNLTPMIFKAISRSYEYSSHERREWLSVLCEYFYEYLPKEPYLYGTLVEYYQFVSNDIQKAYELARYYAKKINTSQAYKTYAMVCLDSRHHKSDEYKACMEKIRKLTKYVSSEDLKELYNEVTNSMQFVSDKKLPEVYRVFQINLGVLYCKIAIANCHNDKMVSGFYVNMANLLVAQPDQNDFDEIINYLAKALNYNNENGMAKLSLVYSYFLTKQYSKAIDMFNTIAPEYANTDEYFLTMLYYYYRHFIFTCSENNDEMQSAFVDALAERIIKNYSFCGDLCYNTALYYGTLKGDFEKAKIVTELATKSQRIIDEAEFYNGMVQQTCLSRCKEQAKFYLTHQKKYAHNDKELEECYRINLCIYYGTFNENKLYLTTATRLVNDIPSATAYYHLANALYVNGKLHEAESWVKKALFVEEDDMSFQLLANIYKEQGKLDLAVAAYQKLYEATITLGANFTFTDVDGKVKNSWPNPRTVERLMKTSLNEIIATDISLEEYTIALAYLNRAKEHFPNEQEWLQYTLLPNLVKETEKAIAYSKQLEIVEEEASQRVCMVRKWALRLIALQDKSTQFDLDDNADWDTFAAEMDNILLELESTIDRSSKTYEDNVIWVDNAYSFLTKDAKSFLATAETLYQLNRNSYIDFAPIIVEYSKVLEVQLRHCLGETIPEELKMLGSVLGTVKKQKIMPYYQFVSDMFRVNNLRISSAHTGILTSNDVEMIRKLYYENGILQKLLLH